MSAFGVLLIAAICLVTPDSSPVTHGWELIAFAVVGTVVLLRGTLVVRWPGGHHHAGVLPIRVVVWRFGLLVVTYCLVAAAGGLLVAGDYQDGLPLMVPAAAIGLSVSLRNSWVLLVDVAEARLRSEQR